MVAMCLGEILIGGAFFGWPSLTTMALREGVYSDLPSCGSAPSTAQTPLIALNSTRCLDDRVSHWNTIFTTTLTVISVCYLLQGFAYDIFGNWRMLQINFAICALGCLCYAAQLREIGYFVFGVAASGVHMGMISSAKALPSMWRIPVLALVNGSYNAGILTMLFFKFLSDSFGIVSTSFFAVLVVVCIIGWAVVFFTWPTEDSSATTQTLSTNLSDLCAAFAEWWRLPENPIKTKAFAVICIYNCVGLYWISFYLMSLHQRILVSSTADSVSTNLSFAIVIIGTVGLVFGSGVAFLLAKDPQLLKKAFAILTVIGIIWSSLLVVLDFGSYAESNPNTLLALRYLSIVMFALFRTLHFSLVTAYIGSLFGFRSIGRLFGFTLFVSGLLTETQTLLSKATNNLSITWWCDLLQWVTLSIALIILVVATRKFKYHGAAQTSVEMTEKPMTSLPS